MYSAVRDSNDDQHAWQFPYQSGPMSECRQPWRRRRSTFSLTSASASSYGPVTIFDVGGAMRLSRFRLIVAAAVPLAVAAATVGVVSVTAHAAAAGCQVTYSV